MNFYNDNSGTVMDACPECGAASYVGGYCFGCGIYRRNPAVDREYVIELPEAFEAVEMLDEGLRMLDDTDDGVDD